MFESIIALTSSTTRKMDPIKFLKTFASFNWNSIKIEINCRPQRKDNGPFSFQYNDFNTPSNQMLRCKKTPLESIILEGAVGESTLKLTCIFSEGTSQWVEAKINSKNKAMVNVVEKQLLNIFKSK